MDEQAGGRREYDPMSPQFEALEQRLLRALETGMADTRHTLRDEFFAPIAAKVEMIVLTGRDTTATLNALAEDVAEMKPELIDHRNRLDALEKSNREDHAVATALEKNRKQGEDNKRQIRTWGISIVAILLGFLTPITVAILTHPH